jgi:hypothetical protein
MYHLLTVNVRTRTEINIPHINFVSDNSQDSLVLLSSLNLLSYMIKQFLYIGVASHHSTFLLMLQV